MRERERETMRQRHKHEASSDSSDELKTQNSSISDSNSTIGPRRVFALCLGFRILNALLVRTYFNPDEHWQALEVAHRIAFGYGHLTWEWRRGIRSYFHPMLFAVLYKLLSFLGLDTPLFMIKAPRLFQSVFSAVGDLYLYKLSQLIFGEHVAKWALFSQLTNWFMIFCITRTLSNSFETVLTIVSLYYWPCLRRSYEEVTPMSRKLALAIAALACAVRPTSAITWLYVGFLELYSARDRLRFVFLEVVPIGVLVLGLTLILDRVMYGSWVLVPLNFLKFNFLSSGGDYYGTHTWHWYFSQGFTVMLFTFTPFFLAGVLQSKQWKLSGLIAWVLGLFSVLGHKEFRFVLPVLPIALMFSGYSLAAIHSSDASNGKRTKSSNGSKKWPLKFKSAVLFLLCTNIPMALYMSLVHQRGTEDVMNHLSKEVLKGNVQSVLFLMPCHATPYYSTLHRNIPMCFLDCSPSETKGIPDESDRFMMDPVGFASAYAKNWSIPSHIVLFESEEKPLKEFLLLHSYREKARFFHAHFKVDRDLQASVVVYALSNE